jgi:short-subunit dehydrogenase involved in D-alanine esterification of teichoic acids
MAVSGHMCGEGNLVKYASAFTPKGGKLILSHIEDKSTLERFLDAIEKIPEIDSDVARENVLNRLLKDAKDYSESASVGLNEAGLEIEVNVVAQVGRRLEDYRNLIEEGHVDLLVMRAKEDDQMAMHGMAHPLAVELRSVPILLL